MQPDILIRNACEEDISFVAGCVLAAVGLYDFRNASVETTTAEQVCGTDGTLYSYRNARIATVDGTPIGCLVSYPGTIYFRPFKEGKKDMKDLEKFLEAKMLRFHGWNPDKSLYRPDRHNRASSVRLPHRRADDGQYAGVQERGTCDDKILRL